ncbi:MAG: hypothetical protein KDK78_07905 [Chlamydiia bacterium]|nr:hypothetical protein [Chlamydiia bacterium]
MGPLSIESQEIPGLIWHLHGHYNEHCDDKTKKVSLEIFSSLQAFLVSKGHGIAFRAFHQKNGPHPAGSWDIYVRNSAIGDACVWMSLKRPLDVPIFFHPVLALQGSRPSPSEEFDAHTRCAIVFGMPTIHGGENIDWNTQQIDWQWVQRNWVDNS